VNDNFKQNVDNVFALQKASFLSGNTQGHDFKITQLKKLKAAILAHKEQIYDAMEKDLGRSREGVDMGEINPIVDEIDFAIEHLAEWEKEERVSTPAVLGNSESSITRESFGVTYIVVPFNYPVYLFAGPLIGAIIGGNTSIIKPSEATPETSRVIEDIVNTTFDASYIHVFQGARDENEYLLSLPFDMIFFTGSPQVGKIVMQAAAKNLTPVILELGGKSPAIIMEDADLDNAVEELVFARMMNSGQTCVAPDYIYAHESIKDRLIAKLRDALAPLYTKAGNNGKIITTRQFDALEEMLGKSRGNVVFRGESDRDSRYFGPAIVDNVDFQDSLMERELFAPIYPVLSYSDIQEVPANINAYHPKPLATYVFTADVEKARDVIDQIPSGDAGVNAMMLHAFSPYLPFGGVGTSGLGHYHGKYSYEAFTHPKSLRVKRTA